MLPPPPKQRYRIEPHSLKASERDRKRSKKAAELIAQRFKDEQRLSREPGNIIAEVRKLQKQYPEWRIEDHINEAWRKLNYRQRYSNNATTTTAYGSPIFTITTRSDTNSR